MRRNYFLLVGYFLVLTFLNTAMAGETVTLSEPFPPLASEYEVNDPVTITYTLTNHVPIRLPLRVSGISAPISRVTVSNDCGDTLPRGPASCNIGLLIAPQVANGGKSFDQQLIIDYQGRLPFVKQFNFFVPKPAAVFIAAGEDTTITSAPLLASSYDGLGATWTVDTIPGLPAQGLFLAATCTGNAPTAVCTAVGRDLTGTTPPLLAESTDAGKTWALKSIPGLPISGNFFTTTCNGVESTAYCLAAGYDLTGDQPPILAQTQDGGVTWGLQTIPGSPAKGAFYGSNCTGSGATALCIAVGQDQTTSIRPPMIAQSVDGGSTWQMKIVPSLPSEGVFYHASCVGSNETAICTAVGKDLSGSQPPLLALTRDGGATWTVPSIAGLPATGIFEETSCTGEGDTAMCIAVGQSGMGTMPPLMVQSNDGGATWSIIPVSGIPIRGIYNSGSCTGEPDTAFCVAGGEDKTISPSPMLVQTINGGRTWNKVTISDAPTDIEFEAVTCTGRGRTAICIAAGRSKVGLWEPLIVQSSNGGITWALKSVNGNPAVGDYVGVGSVGGSGGSSAGASSAHSIQFGIQNSLEKIFNIDELRI